MTNSQGTKFMLMRAFYILLFGVLLAIIESAPVAAAQISQTANFVPIEWFDDRDGSETIGTFSETNHFDPDGVAFQKFDATLGQLNSMTVASFWNLSFDAEIQIPANPAVPGPSSMRGALLHHIQLDAPSSIGFTGADSTLAP